MHTFVAAMATVGLVWLMVDSYSRVMFGEEERWIIWANVAAGLMLFGIAISAIGGWL